MPIAPKAGDDAPQIEDLLPKDTPDGVDDSFVHVRTSDALRFEVRLRNRTIAPTDVDQTFRVVVQIEGDGVILEERTLRVVVPAAVHALRARRQPGRRRRPLSAPRVMARRPRSVIGLAAT